MNRVTLVGRITKDPELKSSNNNTQFVGFTIAVNRTYTNQQGERSADFINCVAFNKQAENLARYVKKGGLIAIDGRLQTSNYLDQTGVNRTRVDVVCDTITYLSSPQNNNNNGGFYNDMQYQENYNQTPQYNQQPQYNNQQNQYNQNRNQNNFQQPYNPGGYNNPYQTNNNGTSYPTNDNQPEQEEPKQNSFDNVEKQFDIGDDDLPF